MLTHAAIWSTFVACICHMSGWNCSHSSTRVGPHSCQLQEWCGGHTLTNKERGTEIRGTFHLRENTFLQLAERVIWRMSHNRRFTPGLRNFSWASPLQKCLKEWCKAARKFPLFKRWIFRTKKSTKLDIREKASSSFFFFFFFPSLDKAWHFFQKSCFLTFYKRCCKRAPFL